MGRKKNGERLPKELFATTKNERGFRTFMGKEPSFIMLEFHKDHFEITHEDEKYLCMKIEQGSQLFRALGTINWFPPKPKEYKYETVKFIRVDGKEVF